VGNLIELMDDTEEIPVYFGNNREQTIWIRRLSSTKLREFTKKHTSRKGRDRAGIPIEKVNEDAVDNDILDWMITRWENVPIPGTKGKEMAPCTREFKTKLPPLARAELMEVGNSENTGDYEEEIEAEKKTSESTPPT